LSVTTVALQTQISATVNLSIVQKKITKTLFNNAEYCILVICSIF